MHYDPLTGRYVERCCYCGVLVTVFDGQHTYDRAGWPGIHECPTPKPAEATKEIPAGRRWER